MKSIVCLLILTLLSCLPCRASVESENKALADSIAVLSKNYEYIVRHKSTMIDSIKALRQKMKPGEQRIRLGESLGRRYLSQNLDSALIYWQFARREAEEAGLEDLALRLEMNILASMPLRGIAVEALNRFEQIDTTGFSPEMKHIYWLNNSELYYNIQRPYPEGEFKNYYRQKAAAALDSLMTFYPENSPVYSFIISYLHQLRGETDLAAASFLEVLPSLSDRPQLYDCAIANVIDFYRGRPEFRELYLNNLYKRTISELNHGNISAKVIAETGQALSDEGDSKLGQSLLLLALEKSETELGPYRHLDHSTYSSLLHRRAVKIQFWTVLFIILLVVALTIVLVRVFQRRLQLKVLKQYARDEELRHQSELTDMHKVTASLLSMALFTDEQLKEYNLFVHRKLKAGQAKDLYQEVQSGHYVQSLSDKFFAMFDESFLDSFPGFIEKLNALLSPGRELSLLPGRRMSPELRIAAFMRLGINDSAKLAQVLGLSINTIYTYRNRLKGRAIDRANFDRNVQRIAFDS